MCAFFSECGDEFDEYVRHVIGGIGGSQRTVSTLWTGRRFKLHYQGEWREGKVHEWNQWKVDPRRHLTKWSVTVELICADASEINTMIKLCVNRVNVKGGGTLQQKAPDDSPLFSLEWLDPPSPLINLEQGVLIYKCPYCRTAEPVVSAHEHASNTRTEECPVCLELSECRVLGCGHSVCHSCWKHFLEATTYGGISFEQLDEETIQRQRARRHELFVRNKLSTRENHFAQLVKNTLLPGNQNLALFRKEIMVESVLMFFYSDVKVVINKLSIDAVKIFLQVLHARKEELFVVLNGILKAELEEFVNSISFYCCDIIADSFRQCGRTRCALPWSELALFHAKQARSRTLLAAAHVFLGSTQQSAGMLMEASRTFDGSLGLGSSAGDVWKYREDLLREIEQWIGTSGKLTPGC